MLFWALDNPPPATFMLISSGDRDFSNALHQLRVRRYNILLAQPQKGSAVLVHAARTVWLWTSLSAGGSSQLVSNETTSRRPVPSPVRQNPNSPSAARQCACSRRPHCGNVFFDLPPENLFLTLLFCMLVISDCDQGKLFDDFFPILMIFHIYWIFQLKFLVFFISISSQQL